MTDRSEGQWRWPLPDDWEPEGLWCVCITIPADQQYFDRLTGALGMLTLSKAWFPDDTGEGPKTVAATWEDALYNAPFQLNEECVIVPIPPIPNQDAADDAAAAIFTAFYQQIVSELNACATTSDDCEACVDTMVGELMPLSQPDAVRGALMQLCRDLNELTSPERDEMETDCPYNDQYNDLKDKIGDNPYDWLNHLSDWMFDWLNASSNKIMNDLNTLGGLIGGGSANNWIDGHGGIPSGGGASFGSDCPWEHTYFFDITGDGFAVMPWLGTAVGTYGDGWQQTHDGPNHFGNWYTGVTIGQMLPAVATLTSVDYNYDAVLSHTGGSPFILFASITGSELLSGSVDVPTEGTDQNTTLPVVGDYDSVGVLLFCSTKTFDDGGEGSINLRSMTIHGTGTNPFL